jgi:Tol biopolymer transport system component
MIAAADIISYEWSPDSTRLAFEADALVDIVDELFVVDLSTGTPSAPAKVNGTFASTMDVNEWAWSPDGTRIAYDADQDVASQDELYLVIFGPTGPGVPIDVSTLTDSGSDVLEWEWSPDGLWLSMEADRDTNDVEELYLISTANPTPGAPIKVGAMPASGDVSGVHVWSPDSKWIAYRADALTDSVFELFLVDASVTPPAAPVKVNGPIVASGSVVADFDFSPAATALVYEADQDTNDVEELYFVTLTGAAPGAPQKLSLPAVTATDSPDWVWTFDGAMLAYDTDAIVDGDTELFWSVVASGTPTTAVKLNGPLTSLGDVLTYAWEP